MVAAIKNSRNVTMIYSSALPQDGRQVIEHPPETGTLLRSWVSFIEYRQTGSADRRWR